MSANLGYLVVAYALFWSATIAYLFSIDRRQHKALKKLDQLEQGNS